MGKWICPKCKAKVDNMYGRCPKCGKGQKPIGVRTTGSGKEIPY